MTEPNTEERPRSAESGTARHRRTSKWPQNAASVPVCRDRSRRPAQRWIPPYLRSPPRHPSQSHARCIESSVLSVCRHVRPFPCTLLFGTRNDPAHLWGSAGCACASRHMGFAFLGKCVQGSLKNAAKVRQWKRLTPFGEAGPLS
jgi:hypothetical protein